MGLFSTGKQVFVSSVVYNLAGPPIQRPEYIKTAVVSALFNRSQPPVGKAVVQSLLQGPGIRLRSFGRWATSSGYTALVGQTSGTLSLPDNINQTALAALIPADPGQTVALQTSTIGVADYTYWVDRYMLENHPDLIDTAYTADFNKADTTITIAFEGGGSTTFIAVDYALDARYLYATYSIVSESTIGALVPGSSTTVAGSGDFPSTSGWTLTDTLLDSGAGFTSTEEVWERTTYTGWSGSNGELSSLTETMYLLEHTNTTTLVVTYSHRTDEQVTVISAWSPLQLLIYREGSGNTDLDALFIPVTSVGGFLPYIPIRLDNQFLSESFNGDILPLAKKALKRATQADYADLVSKVADNPSLADIDYCFVVFGVALNAQDNASKRYLYEFFQQVMLGRDLSGDSYREWRTAYDANKIIESAWVAWTSSQGDSEHPLYGTAQPPQPVFPPVPLTEVRVRSSDRPLINYDMMIQWNSIEEITGSGLQNPSAKVGSLWFETLPRDVITDYLDVPGENGVESVAVITETNHVKLHWQVSATSWRTLEFYGLAHKNLVYQGKSVDILADNALADPDESGFIIPIHEGVLADMPLSQSTQMSISCAYLVFNAYEEVKEKWYETAWFKVLLFVGMVAFAAFTGYIDPNAIGILGSNAAVGAGVTAGLTGVTALIVGSIANALAAAMLMQLVGFSLSLVTDARIAAIITVALSIAMMTMSFTPSADGIGFNLSTDFSSLLGAESLLKLTATLGNAYAEIIKDATRSFIKGTEETLNSYNEQSQDIATQTEALLGGADVFNVMELTDAFEVGYAEPVNAFLSRTLMTGSEIADLSLSLVSDYTTLTLNTELIT